MYTDTLDYVQLSVGSGSIVDLQKFTIFKLPLGNFPCQMNLSMEPEREDITTVPVCTSSLLGCWRLNF